MVIGRRVTYGKWRGCQSLLFNLLSFKKRFTQRKMVGCPFFVAFCDNKGWLASESSHQRLRTPPESSGTFVRTQREVRPRVGRSQWNRRQQFGRGSARNDTSSGAIPQSVSINLGSVCIAQV